MAQSGNILSTYHSHCDVDFGDPFTTLRVVFFKILNIAGNFVYFDLKPLNHNLLRWGKSTAIYFKL